MSALSRSIWSPRSNAWAIKCRNRWAPAPKRLKRRSAGSLTSFGDENALISRQDPTQTTPGFNFSHIQSYTYTSTFNSLELNYRVRQRTGRDRLELSRDGTWVRQETWLVGVRFFVLRVRGHEAAVRAPEADRFLRSFRVQED